MKHSTLVKRLAKSGEEICQDLIDKPINLNRLLEASDNLITAGYRLDKAKKQAVYNKELGLPVSHRGVLGEITPEKAHLLHMAIGIAGEAAELLEAVVNWVDGTVETLDIEHCVEESGDIEFYHEGFRQGIEVTREEVLDENISKLTKRYGLTYSDEAAQARIDKA